MVEREKRTEEYGLEEEQRLIETAEVDSSD